MSEVYCSHPPYDPLWYEHIKQEFERWLDQYRSGAFFCESIKKDVLHVRELLARVAPGGAHNRDDTIMVAAFDWHTAALETGNNASIRR